MASGIVASEGSRQQGKNRRDDRQMLKQIQDAIKFILNYAGVCIRRDRCVVECVCVCGGGGGGRGGGALGCLC